MALALSRSIVTVNTSFCATVTVTITFFDATFPFLRSHIPNRFVIFFLHFMASVRVRHQFLHPMVGHQNLYHQIKNFD